MTWISKTMKCPKCGAEMNLHAQKLIQGTNDSDSDTAEALHEFYACHQCGAAASRKSDAVC